MRFDTFILFILFLAVLISLLSVRARLRNKKLDSFVHRLQCDPQAFLRKVGVV